ncbi:MAG: hypothetical protein ABSD74_09420 [Rhizomicrobium sp.]|jgi:hypothetical protein
MIKLFQVLALLGLLAVGACASKMPSDTPANFVPLRENCSTSEAIPIELKQFGSDPDRYFGKCIRTRGLVFARYIFPDLPSLYGHPQPEETIAIYGASPQGYELWDMRKFVDVVGFAYSCESLWANAEVQAQQSMEEAKKKGSGETTIPFLAGECHYHAGPILYVSQIAIDGGAATRFFGPAAAEKYGNLTPMAHDTPHAAEIVEAIAPAFQHVRKRDEESLKAHLEKLGMNLAASEAKMAIDPNRSPFSFLLGAGRAPEIHYFLLKTPSTDAASDYVAFGCVCKVSDCEGTWPIHSADTNADPDWPYACMSAQKNGKITYLDLN